ncbi:hypothetical protein EOA22_23405 [Mesorhizobium sp. M7A.F.Ca.US.014.04.1.1]|nr:hypothetical protein EOC84_19180 [Mesorhizobium sp. Primo-B]RUU41638.1 hypothetical protein EOC83_00265 [Mesorhizobium sp. Primo-A]RUX11909.1 hypothetical protein EN996_25560 [Mesorhizobium sp. M7A.F.Ca.CA.002.14.1.2]RUX40662.1 hypothetical protein EN987_06745 [Mesorhizobium sp. M7A.F.Ca.CA.002.11.2.1]RUX57302.1 hypothetical protein EN994_07985 [Mesorhizobium sp. M7A.F.Ca.CA.002.09.1.1]RUX58145.1 hypothetical protein EN989_17585 [Mesorhizobium sp. M7A.F.Ca.CA.002.12.1.1]RUX59447.1 hypothet
MGHFERGTVLITGLPKFEKRRHDPKHTVWELPVPLSVSVQRI